MGSRRRRFSDEFKHEAVRLAFEGSRPVAEVARELAVRPDQLRKSGAGSLRGTRSQHRQRQSERIAVCVGSCGTRRKSEIS